MSLQKRFIPALLLSCVTAFSQSQTGSLSGTVLDSNNAAVPGAMVETTLMAASVTLQT